MKVVEFADHAAALAEAAVMVTHAGLGSTAAALMAGVPLVCTPIGRDQPLNPRLAADLGAAVIIESPASNDIAQTVTNVITTPDFAHAARAIAVAAQHEGGAPGATTDIFSLLR